MLGFSTVFLIAASVCLVDAHPDGAPAEACDTLTPNHNGHVGQTSEVPYVINLTQFDVGNGSYVYSPGRIYARKISHSNYYITVTPSNQNGLLTIIPTFTNSVRKF